LYHAINIHHQNHRKLKRGTVRQRFLDTVKKIAERKWDNSGTLEKERKTETPNQISREGEEFREKAGGAEWRGKDKEAVRK